MKKITIRTSGASRYAKSERKPGRYYFELRTGDSSLETLICDGAIVNNEGSIEASRDILADAVEAGLIPDRSWSLFWGELERLYDEIDAI